MKKIIALILAAVCMLTVFSGCTAGTSENEGGEGLLSVTDPEQTKSKYPMVSETLLVGVYEKTLYIADSKGNIHTEALAEGLVKKQYSLDGSRLMAVTESTWTLLYFDGEELKAIADDTYSSAMSADGRVIAYTMPGSTGKTDDLYRYEDGKSTYIASGYIGDLVISPDGSAIAYYGWNENDDIESYYWDGSGDVKPIGNGKEPMGISNNAEYIYYSKQESSNKYSFWVQSGSSDGSFTQTRLDADGAPSKIFLNADGTEVLYRNGGVAEICVKGGAPIPVGDNSNDLIYPQGTQEHVNTWKYTVYGLESFGDCFLKGSDGVVYVDQNFEVTPVCDDNADLLHLCRSRATVFYEQDGTVYRFDGSRKESQTIALFEGECQKFIDDGKTVFYTKDGALYQCSGMDENAQSVKLVDSEHFDVFLTAFDESGTVYYIVDSKLMAQTGQGEPRTVVEDFGHGGSRMIEFKDKLYYSYDGRLFCIDGSQVRMIEEVPFCSSVTADDRMLIIRAKTMLKEDVSGCWFSVDGENFKPLVEKDSNDGEKEPVDQTDKVIIPNQTEKVSVPDLVGQNYETLPDYFGITVCRQSSAYSDEYAKGEIIDQYPDADTEVISGTKVFVVVSLGEEPTEP